MTANPWAVSPADLQWETHYGRRVRCYRQRPAHFWAAFAQAARHHPARTALVAGRRRWSYAELAWAVEKAAATMAVAYGVQKGERVALLLGNVPEFVIALLAAVRLGAVVVPLSNRLQREELRHMLGDSGACLLVVGNEQWSRVEPLLPALPELRGVATVGETVAGVRPFADFLAEQEEPLPLAGLAEDDPLFVIYTAGTTGRPKGAVITHFNLVHTLLNLRYCLELSHRDVALVAVPCCHNIGIAALICPMLYLGGTVVLQAAFHPGECADLLVQEAVSYTVLVPTMYIMLLGMPDLGRRNLQRWRVAAYGGAPMAGEVIRRLRHRLPNTRLYNIYGLTETTSPCTALPDPNALSMAPSVGLPLPVTDLKVVDEVGAAVEPNQVGELLVSGPQVIREYWHDAMATAAAINGGWLRTGDLARIDHKGYLHIMDRKKDMINRAGEKIYSLEVENCLHGHPRVLEAAVVGQPDPLLGEIVKAVVVPQPGETLTPDEVQQWVRERLADYKVPAVVSIIGELPKNPGGKVLKRALREL